MNEYRSELIQVAAVALCMAQIDEVGSTSRTTPIGAETESRLLEAIAQERRCQEEKWGTRYLAETTREWWYTVLGEEFGEVGKAILEAK